MSLTILISVFAVTGLGLGYLIGHHEKEQAANEAMLRGLDMGYSQAKSEYERKHDSRGRFVKKETAQFSTSWPNVLKSQLVNPPDSK